MIYIFTGAGCSADSGIPTFRDSGGLWEKYDPNEICYLPKFIADPAIRPHVFDFYNARKTAYAAVKPHDGHYAIFRLQARTPVKVITTNIDMLHEYTGVNDVLHVHGTLQEMNCVDCGHSWDIGDSPFEGDTCPNCSSTLVKPGVIFFGENAPSYDKYYEIIRNLTRDDTFIIVGASLNVLNPIYDMRRCHIFNPLTDGVFGTPRIIVIDPNLPLECLTDGIESICGTAVHILPKLLPSL